MTYSVVGVYSGRVMRFVWDPEKEDEDRSIVVAPIKWGVIVVAYTERDDDVLRLLIARMATKNERRRFEAYEKGRHGRRDS